MISKRVTLPAVLILCAVVGGTAAAGPEPHVGYVYPAGARQGDTVRVVAGGQFLRGVENAFVSGEGVQARVVRYLKPTGFINKEQRLLIGRRMAEARDQRLEELGIPDHIIKRIGARTSRKLARLKKQNLDTEGVELPDLPVLFDLDNQTLRELAHARSILSFPRQKLQKNRQLAESVLVEIRVEPDAPPGYRSLRIKTKLGLTNPVTFRIGQAPEVRELEPNDGVDDSTPVRRALLDRLPVLREALRPRVHDLPVVLNGQIMPGDIDRFHFRAEKGQRLVFDVSARRLVPYLADAVPGWFQAVLTLYDSEGNEVAYVDDYRFHPDPVLLHEVERDGEYVLEIRDAVHRGREDFVYRIAVGERPFITHVFPLGGREGTDTPAVILGWNLPESHLMLDTRPGSARIRNAFVAAESFVSNSIPYAVDDLPECGENEPNDSPRDARLVEMPQIVNGRIGRPGDMDAFRIEGDAGDRVAVEVSARRLRSPLDSLVRLTDPSGKVLKWNDDHVVKKQYLHVDDGGLLTHHADSYLVAGLPEKGTYYVVLTDARHHGSDAHAYRLRISAPRPDFALRFAPSSFHTRPGGIVPVTVHALRKDGFEGDIELVVAQPEGFELHSARIPAGRTGIRTTMRVPDKSPGHPVDLTLEGTARIDGKIVRRTATAADNVMQAFLYRHLAPADSAVAAIKDVRWPMPPLEIQTPTPIRLPRGGSATVRITTPRRIPPDLILQLKDPPTGVTLGDVTVSRGRIEFQLTAGRQVGEGSHTENLIVEILKEFKRKNRRRRFAVGYLPAIPVAVGE